jgi:hypothetical protein
MCENEKRTNPFLKWREETDAGCPAATPSPRCFSRRCERPLSACVQKTCRQAHLDLLLKLILKILVHLSILELVLLGFQVEDILVVLGKFFHELFHPRIITKKPLHTEGEVSKEAVIKEQLFGVLRIYRELLLIHPHEPRGPGIIHKEGQETSSRFWSTVLSDMLLAPLQRIPSHHQ